MNTYELYIESNVILRPQKWNVPQISIVIHMRWSSISAHFLLVHNHVNVNDDDDSQAVPVRVFTQSGEHLLIVNKYKWEIYRESL